MSTPPLEKSVESYLLDQCRRHGFLCLKFSSPSRSGVPDRLIVSSSGTDFVEVKRPGESPRKLQRLMHAKLRRYGGVVHVVDDRAGVDQLISELRHRCTSISDLASTPGS